MQYFKTSQLYFKSVIDQFDILAVSEHSLFEEQLGMLKTATDGTYNYHAVSASDNPRIISGEKAHGGVALLWKYSINDFATPIKSIQSDRIVGIKCEFSGCRQLFILGVYLPSSNHTLDEFQECLDLLWALYESLSADGFVIVLGDVNGDLGNCLGVRGKKEPKLLIDFANFFNVCPVNLCRVAHAVAHAVAHLRPTYLNVVDFAQQLIIFCCPTIYVIKLLCQKHLILMLIIPLIINQLFLNLITKRNFRMTSQLLIQSENRKFTGQISVRWQ